MSAADDLLDDLFLTMRRHCPLEAGDAVDALGVALIKVFKSAPPDERMEAVEGFAAALVDQVRKTLQ